MSSAQIITVGIRTIAQKALSVTIVSLKEHQRGCSPLANTINPILSLREKEAAAEVRYTIFEVSRPD